MTEHIENADEGFACLDGDCPGEYAIDGDGALLVCDVCSKSNVDLHEDMCKFIEEADSEWIDNSSKRVADLYKWLRDEGLK